MSDDRDPFVPDPFIEFWLIVALFGVAAGVILTLIHGCT